MPFIDMALRHPIDAEIRERLRKLAPNQAAFAALIGRKQPWLHKFMNGDGHATVDDVIRITAVMIGVEQPAVTESERRLLKAWRGISDAARREDAVLVFENIAKGYRRGQQPESAVPTAHTPRATARKGRGTRKAAGG